MKRLFVDRFGITGFGIICLLILFLIALFGGGGFISYKLEIRNCEVKADNLGLRNDYDFWASTCFVELPNGAHVDINSIKFTQQGTIVPG